MPVQPNASFTFTGYEVLDVGIRLDFVCADPGPGQVNNYDVVVTDSDMAGITTQQLFVQLVRTKLERKVRAVGIASRLDPMIGQSLVI